MLVIVRGLPGSGKNNVRFQSDFSYFSYDSALFGICDTAVVKRGAFHQEVMTLLLQAAEHACRVRIPTVIITQAPRIREVQKFTNIAKKWGCPYFVVSIDASLVDVCENIQASGHHSRIMNEQDLTKISIDFQNSLKAADSAFSGNHVVVKSESEARDIHFRDPGEYHIPKEDRHRVWIFGDLHGKRALLRKALRQLPDDAIIFSAGDLIDRGEDSMGCLFDLMEDERFKLFAMGNHELRFIEEEVAGYPCRSRAREQTHREFDALAPQQQAQVMDFLKYRSRAAIQFTSAVGKNKTDDLPHVILSHTGIGGDAIECANLLMTTSGSVMPITDFSYPRSAEGKVIQVHGHYSWEYTGDTTGCIVNIDSHAYHTGVLRFFNPYTREVFDVRE